MSGPYQRAAVLVVCAVSQAVAPVRAADPPALVVRTVAGGGAGDGGSALDASLTAPVRAVPTPYGLLVSDRQDHRVRRVDGSGTIRPFAGHGMPGYGGDGGRATTAALDDVGGIAVDRAGRVYLADAENDRVRRVDAAGTIATFAGGGTDAESLGDGGPATAAVLDSPSDVAVAPDGTVYVADTGNNRLRKVSPSGVISTVVAAPEDAGFQPSAVAVAPNGTVYVADTDAHRVWRVSGGALVAFAGTGTEGFGGDGGPAAAAMLSSPSGLAVDAAGAVLVADSANHRIRRVAGGRIATVAGPEGLAEPEGVSAAPDGTVYVADTGNARVHRLGAGGSLATVAGNGTTFAGDGGPAPAAAFGAPVGVATDAAGALYVADAVHHRVRLVRDGVVTTVAGNGATTCAGGNGEPRVCVGGFGGDGGPATAASLNAPAAVAVSGAGALYIADTLNHVVRRRDPSGTIVAFAGNRANRPDGTCPDALTNERAAEGGSATAACLAQPGGVAVDPAGNVLVADTGNDRLVRITAAGTLTTVMGGGAIAAGPALPVVAGMAARLVRLSAPRGVAVAPDGTIYVADTGNHRVLRVDPSGNAAVVAGTGTVGNTGDGGAATAATLALPSAVAVDAAGAVYISDTGNDRVRKVVGTTITAFAGGGTPSRTSYFGDGGDPAAASFATPLGVAVSGDRVYVADSAHARVRAVVPAPPPSRLALAVSVPTITAGQAVTVTATATNAASGAPLAGATVRLLERPAGAAGRNVVTAATTGADGAVRVTLRPARRTTYTAEVDDSELSGPGTATAVVAVRYAPVVTAPRTSAKAGTAVPVSGRVQPVTGGVRVEVVKVAGGKATVLTRTTTRGDGRYAASVTLPRGTYTLRVRVPAAAGNETGESKAWTLQVT